MNTFPVTGETISLSFILRAMKLLLEQCLSTTMLDQMPNIYFF